MGEVPADKVRKIFGGAPRVAELLGLSVVQVYRWSYPVKRHGGGHGGRVPPRHHSTLLDAARAQGLDLSYEDLNPPGLPALNGKPAPEAAA